MNGNLVIVAKNTHGLSSDLLFILSHAKIHVEQVSGLVRGDDAVVSLSVSDPQKAKMLLENNGYNVINSEDTVIATFINSIGDKANANSMDNKANALAQLASSRVKLTELKEIANLGSHSVFALSVDRVARARRLLSPNLLSNFDLVTLPTA